MIDGVAIVSGGMDSVTLLHYLVKKESRTPAVLTFLYGQKHQNEVALAQEHAALLGCTDHLVLDLAQLRPLFTSSALVNAQLTVPSIDEVQGDVQPRTYVPNRNMIFLAMAAAYAESHGVTELYYGAQAQDMYGYWDTTPNFLDKVNAVFGLNRQTPIRVNAPFITYAKADVLRIGLQLGVDYGRTWSCYEGADLACGTCPTCAERLQAFAEVGLSDPIRYQEN